MVLGSAFAVCAVAYAALIIFALTANASRRGGGSFIAVLIFTFGWALASAFEGWGVPGVAQLLQLLQTAACVAYLASLLARPAGATGQAHLFKVGVWGAAALGLIVLVNDLRHMTSAASLEDISADQMITRVVLAVLGLLVTENIYRNTPVTRRWHIYPLCIAFGALFAYDLFVYSDAMLFRIVNPTFVAARGAVATLICPLLGLTIVRNRGWRVDFRPSRQAVLYTVTLIASGVLLLSVAIVGYILRETGGRWGAFIQIAILAGALIVLLTVLTSGSLRSRMKHVLILNFFSHRYDYRVEWMKFIDALAASDGDDSLQVRVIRAVGNIVDSPAGILWTLREGTGYCPAAFWNMHIATNALEPQGGPFIAAFQQGSHVQQFGGELAAASEASTPAWFGECPTIWLAVPLVHNGRLTAFIIFAPPRAPFPIDLESFSLLLAVGRQAASYLSEDTATRALMDSRLLHDYSKRFAFVVHDIKNLVSQLDLVVANAREHGDDPEFRDDMLHTLHNSVARMKALLVQLSANRIAPRESVVADLPAIIASVVGDLENEAVPIFTELDANSMTIAMDPEQFRSSLYHLVTNAIEATVPGGKVTISTHDNGAMAYIDVRDDGPGMEPEFVQNELFKPFHSSKPTGYGIGAYQTREQIRAAGGDLEVISKSGTGTTMRIVVPIAALRTRALTPTSAEAT